MKLFTIIGNGFLYKKFHLRCYCGLIFLRVGQKVELLNIGYRTYIRKRSRTPTTFLMELFGIIVNGFHSLSIFLKSFILDAAGVLGPPLHIDYLL